MSDQLNLRAAQSKTSDELGLGIFRQRTYFDDAQALSRAWVLGSTAAALLMASQPGFAQLWQRQDAGGITYMGGQVDSAAPAFLPRVALPQRSLGIGNLTDVQVAPLGRSRLLATAEDSLWFQPLRPVLQEAAQRHRVDYHLIKAVIAAESAFNPSALSPKGAVGLMQLMPATASRFGVTADADQTIQQKLADPATNIAAGTRYLRYLLDMFPGRTDLALAAYNAGEGAVQRAGNQIPRYPETQNYTRKVMAYYEQLAPNLLLSAGGGAASVAGASEPPGIDAQNLTPTRSTGSTLTQLTATPARMTPVGSVGSAQATPLQQSDVRMIVGAPTVRSDGTAPMAAPASVLAPPRSSFHQGGVDFLVGSGGTPAAAP